MGEVQTQIPFLEISREAVDLEQGGENWKALSRKVGEVCEKHGCFLVKYNKVPMNSHEDLFMAMKTLFDLPEETKKKYKTTTPAGSYASNGPMNPLSETFGIDNASLLNSAQAFTSLMWPEGNPTFCSTMLELNFIILKMIVESFGMGKEYKSHAENSGSSFRVMKYKVPPSNDSATGLLPHTDKSSLSIICQNEVQGLEVLSKQGNWIQVMVPQGSFFVIVGDVLKAWSNGRLHAAKHRVVMSGSKERYSCALFTAPKKGVKVEVPQELVDKEHPLLYRPFIYMDYISYSFSNTTTSTDDALEIYAGV